MSSLPTPIEPDDVSLIVSLDERRDRIMAVLERTALDIGAELLAAKDEHPGGFVAWVEESLPFGIDKAERLMAITRTLGSCDESTKAFLPPAWTALYELTRLAPERLQRAIEVGEVSPTMTTREAKDLARSEASPPLPKIEPPREDSPAPSPTTASTRGTRLSCDIVARELMRYPRNELTEEVSTMMTNWLRGHRREL